MRKAFIDCDNCLINSTKIITDILNIRYNKKVSWKDVKQYNLRDQFPEVSKKEIIELFDSRDFFLMATKEIFPHCREVVDKLCEDFEVYVVSIGTPDNIARKSIFLQEMFPNIKNYILLSKSDGTMYKSIIKMGKQDFLIDDHINNISTSTAGNRILFSYEGIKHEWNKNSDGIEIISSWEDIERRIYGNI